MIRLLATTAAFALLAGSAQADFVLHVLHTNDFHSRVEPINAFDSTCDAETEAKGECFGGVARLATRIAELRKGAEDAGEAVILVDAGDQFQGSLFYTTYKGKDTVEFMNRLAYDAMAVGNHEFDDGPEGLAVLAEGADFPILSSNTDVSQSNVLKGKIGDTAIIEAAGQRIGIVGATTLATPEIASPGPNVIFLDDLESVRAGVEELTAAGVNKIIAVTHIGYGREQEIAKQAPGLDAVVGGHTHSLLQTGNPDAEGPYPTMVAGPDGAEVPVVQAYAYGKYLGHLKLTFDDAGKLLKAEGQPELLDASVTPDPDLAARVAEMAAPIQALREKIVAEVAAPLNASRKDCRARECEMGNVVAEAMLDRVKDQGVTIAIANGGGLRASIDAGPVSMGEIYDVLPFQNTLSTFEATGATILAALENGASGLEEEAGRFAQVAGLKYTLDSKAPVGSRISDVQLRGTDGGWTPIDPAATYKVVTNNYVRTGGDGYEMFATGGMNAYDFGPDLAEVLGDWLAAQGPDFAPKLDGRITVN